MTIDKLRAMSKDFSTVSLARVRNAERDQRSVVSKQLAGLSTEAARAEVRQYRGSVLGAMMREFGLKDARSEDPGLLELLVYIAYKRLDETSPEQAEANLASL